MFGSRYASENKKPVEVENYIIIRIKTVDDIYAARHDRQRVLYPARRYRQRPQFIKIIFILLK